MAIPPLLRPNQRQPASPGGLQTRFADEQAFVEEQQRRHTHTPEDSMADALMRMIRYTSITAAPPAHIRPTVWSDSVDLSGSASVAAAVGAYTTVVSFTVPDGRGARIEQYGVNVLTAGYPYDGSLLWRFLKNGSPLDLGMSDWGEQRGSMVFPRKTVITLEARDKLFFQVKRAALTTGGVLSVQMGFRGWIWRKRNSMRGTQGSTTAY
jgi:hypothetical protein